MLHIEYRYTYNRETGDQIVRYITVAGTSYTACFVRAAAEIAAIIPTATELLTVEFWQRHA